MHSAIAASGDAGDLERSRSRFGPPDNEAPAVVGVSGVIGRSDDAAIMLVGLARYTTGLHIDLAIRRRLDPETAEPMHWPHDTGVLVGVELADGRAVVAGHGWSTWPAADEPTLAHRGGGGGGREWSSSLWLTPAPPPGDLVLVVASARLGIDESSLRVDAEALSVAADRTQVLWTREPDQAQPAVEQPPVDVPAGGWFERAFTATRTDEPLADPVD